MVVFSETYAALCLPTCNERALLLFKAAIALSSISYTSAMIREPRDLDIATSTTNMTNGTPDSILNTTKEPANCYHDGSSDSNGDDIPFCLPGERMTSDDDPCPGSEPCCPCRPGTFLSEENTCTTCIPHTECEEIKSKGDFSRDNVCVKSESENIQAATVDPSPPLLQPTDARTEPEEADTGQEVITNPPSTRPSDSGTEPVNVDNGQDGENSGSSKFPWLLIVMIVISVILVALLVVCMFLFICRWTRKQRSYAKADKDDVEMQSVTRPNNRTDTEINGSVPREN